MTTVEQALSFVVLGRPQPGGSKKGVAIRRGGEFTGKVAVVDAAKGARSWKQDVKAVASQALVRQDAYWRPFEGPLELDVLFVLRRPKGHYGMGRNRHLVKASAPAFPAVAPDTLKLTRLVEDALTGLVYRDDAQIVLQVARKVYGEPERCEVTVRPAEDASELEGV